MLHAGSLQANSPLQSEAPPLASSDNIESPAQAPAVLSLYNQQHAAAQSSGISHGAVAGIAGKPPKSDAVEGNMPLNTRFLKGEMLSKLPFGYPSLRGRERGNHQIKASLLADCTPLCGFLPFFADQM